MKHFVFILCFLVASTFVTIQEALADPCPVRIAYAGLVGLGTPHGTAEYQLVFAPDQGYDTGPFTVRVTAVMQDGSQSDFAINGVSANASRNAVGAGELTVYPFATEVRSFRVAGAQDWKKLSTCSDDPPYAVDNQGSSTSVSFDDGSQSAWPIKSSGQIQIVDADFTGRQVPQYPLTSRSDGLEGANGVEGFFGKDGFDGIEGAEGVEGSSIVLVVINYDGSVAVASIYQSSGSAALDQASLKAARGSTFKPAHLSKALGGAAITSAYVIVYTFNSGM